MSIGPEYTSSSSFPKHPPITDEISSNIVIAVTDFREFNIFFETLYQLLVQKGTVYLF